MTTAFKTVQDAIVAALITPATIVSSRVAASRERPLAAEHANDIVVSIESCAGDALTLDGDQMQWDVVYGIEIRARGTATTDAVAVADPVLQAAYARLHAATPPTGCDEWAPDAQIRWDTDEEATHLASVRFSFHAQVRTQPHSLLLATT